MVGTLSQVCEELQRSEKRTTPKISSTPTIRQTLLKLALELLRKRRAIRRELLRRKRRI